jgi:Zn-dependent membrane protease YugP
MYGYYWDPTYVLVLIGAVLCIAASAYMKSTYSKYTRVRSRSGMTGAEAAQKLLTRAGIRDVTVQHVNGELTDHYDPRKKVLRLSDSVYDSHSVAAIGVAAHECGHAMQHNNGYLPLKLRSLLVPAANIGSKLGLPLVFLGMIIGWGVRIPGSGVTITLVEIGIWIFAIAVLFQVITLPVEFNASQRALRALGDYGVMGTDEVADCRHVLTAAALTYVAAAASSLLQLLRLVLLSGRRGRR